MNLCGHATLAAAHILLHGEQVRFTTKSGILTVSREEGLLKLDMPAAPVEPADLPELTKALGVDGADVPQPRGQWQHHRPARQ